MVEARVALPEPHPEDDEDVVWGLSTATALWARGERRDAIVWLRRAADAARAAGQDFRASELGISVADLEERLSALEEASAPKEIFAEDTHADEPPAPEAIDRMTMEIEPEIVSVDGPSLAAQAPPLPAAAHAHAHAHAAPVAPSTPVAEPPPPASVASKPPAVAVPLSAPPGSSSLGAPVISAPAPAVPAVSKTLPEGERIPRMPGAQPSISPPSSQAPKSKKARAPILDPWADEPTPLPTPPPSSLRVIAKNDELMVSRRSRPTARAGEDEDGVYTSAVPIEMALGKKAPKPPPPPPPAHHARTKTIDQRNKTPEKPGQIAPSVVTPKSPSSGASPTDPGSQRGEPVAAHREEPVSSARSPQATAEARSDSAPAFDGAKPPSSTSEPVITPAPERRRAPVSPLPPAFPRTSQSDEYTASAAPPVEESPPPPPPAPPVAPLELDDLEPLGVAQTMPAPADNGAATAPLRLTDLELDSLAASGASGSARPVTPAPPAPVVSPPRSPSSPAKKPSIPPDSRTPSTKRVSSRPAGDPGPILGGLALGRIDGLADLPNDSLALLLRTARLESLAPDEEVAGFGAALVLEGDAVVCATIVDAPAMRAPTGTLIPSKGTLQDGILIRVVAQDGITRVAVWDQAALDEAVRLCPWVLDELIARADRVLARAGATMGGLGDVDESSRNLLLDRLSVRIAQPLEVLAELGKPAPGVILVGAGTVDLLAPNAIARSGDILFPREVIGGQSAPSDARTGPHGALLLVGPKHVAQELFVTAPSLVDFLGGQA